MSCESTLTVLKISIIAQKMKFSIKDFISKCDQIRSFQRIWSHLRKKSLMENFIFLRNAYALAYSAFVFFSQHSYVRSKRCCHQKKHFAAPHTEKNDSSTKFKCYYKNINHIFNNNFKIKTQNI